MAEYLNQFARKHEIVPVKMWRQDGIEGWLFRDRKNELLFVSTSDLVASAPLRENMGKEPDKAPV